MFFKRYVDDCLVCAKESEQQIILDVFNGFHERLQFTIEYEVEGEIKFLDTILRRGQSGITAEWFPKGEKGRYLDFQSVSPFSQKKNSVITLVDRVIKLTHVNYRQKTLNTVKEMLKIINYPSQFVFNVIKDRTHTMYNYLNKEKLIRPFLIAQV